MKPPNLDNDTPLIPEILVERITQDEEMQRLICQRARWHFAHNAQFRKGCKGRRSREYLTAFMDHWQRGGKSRLLAWIAAKERAESTYQFHP